jgi:hypothetical protein
VVLECYFDAANKPTLEYDRVVLATVCGTPEQWKSLNADWDTLLDQHSAPPLHTIDAASLSKKFRRERGWNDTRVDDFIIDAVKVIRKHLRILSPQLGLHVTTLTIMLDDFRRARAEVPLLTKNINDLCRFASALSGEEKSEPSNSTCTLTGANSFTVTRPVERTAGKQRKMPRIWERSMFCRLITLI